MPAAVGSESGTLVVIAMAIASLVLGALSGWRITRRMRLPVSVDGDLLSWHENPVSFLRQDPFVGSLLASHDVLAGVMGVLAALTSIRVLTSPLGWLPPSEPTGAASWSIRLARCAVVALSVGLAWYVIGARWVLPLADRRFRPIRVVLAEEGVYRGQLHMPWRMFGEVHRDVEHGLLHLSSSASHDLIALTVRPPTRDLLSEAHHIMQARVPTPSVRQRTRWYRRKAVFGLAYLMTALPLILIGLWLCPSQAVWVCAFQGFAPWLATWLGARVLQAYQWDEDSPHPAIGRVQV
jgi:hypothetical protein